MRYGTTTVFMLAALAGAWATGCRPSSESQQGKEVVRHISQLSDNDIVVSVDGKNLTRRALSDTSKFQAAIYAKKINADADDKRVAEFRTGCEQGGIAEFVIQTLLVEEAKRRGLSLTKQMEEEHARIFARFLGLDDKKPSYESLARSTGVSPKTLRAYLGGNRLAQLVQESFAVAPEDVPEADVTNLVANAKRINEECAASNELQRCVLAEALAATKGGMPFDEAAAKYSEIKPEEGGKWGTFTKSELRLYEHSGRKFTEWAFTAPAGDITPEPVQLDDGVSIVKILGRQEGVDGPSVVAVADQATVELARITRKAFDPPDVPTPDEARANLAEERTKAAQIAFNQKLFLGSRVEYPNGTNLWNAALAP